MGIRFGFALAAAVLAGGAAGTFQLATVTAAQARAAERTLGYAEAICERTRFRRSEINAIRKRADFADILGYTLDHCAPVAAVLGDGATGTTAGGTAGSAGRGELEELCRRTVFTRRELTAYQRRADFVELLDYTLENCPAVAAVLTDVPTATITDDQGNGDGGTGTGGVPGTGGGGGGGGGGDTGTGGGGDTGTGGGGDTGTGGGGGDTGTGGGGDTGTGGGGDTGTGGGCRNESRGCDGPGTGTGTGGGTGGGDGGSHVCRNERRGCS